MTSDLLRATADPRLQRLEHQLSDLYQEFDRALTFHGWHHIEFVLAHAVRNAQEIGANPDLVAAAALVHDLNYMAERNSGVKEGRELRSEVLADAGYAEEERFEIETIVVSASTENRGGDISDPAKALSDADTLYKILPISPILLTSRYLAEGGVTLRELCDKILDEQEPLVEEDVFFYLPSSMQRYGEWARTNLELWSQVREALKNPEIEALVTTLTLKWVNPD